VSAKALCKDVGAGLIAGCVVAVIVIRSIELYARSYVAQTDVPAVERVSFGSPCQSGDVAFR
jgi:hypothetical protein